MQASWRILRSRFLHTIDHPVSASEPHWRQVWRVVVSDPWYQAELEVCAQRAAQRSNLHCHEDVRQDAILLLARQMRRRLDLGINRSQAEGMFPVWLRTIIERDCSEATRRLRSRIFQKLPYSEICDEQQFLQRIDVWLDLRIAISELDFPEREVLERFLEGESLRAIGEQFGYGYNRSHYFWRRGIEKLRRKFVGS